MASSSHEPSRAKSRGCGPSHRPQPSVRAPWCSQNAKFCLSRSHPCPPHILSLLETAASKLSSSTRLSVGPHTAPLRTSPDGDGHDVSSLSADSGFATHTHTHTHTVAQAHVLSSKQHSDSSAHLAQSHLHFLFHLQHQTPVRVGDTGRPDDTHGALRREGESERETETETERGIAR